MALDPHDGLLGRIATAMAEKCERIGADGVVLDMASVGVSTYGPPWPAFIQTVSRVLRGRQRALGLIVTAQPIRRGDGLEFHAGDLYALNASVDYVSLMTYDYSNAARYGRCLRERRVAYASSARAALRFSRPRPRRRRGAGLARTVRYRGFA